MEKQSKQIWKKTLVKQPSITYHSPKNQLYQKNLRCPLDIDQENVTTRHQGTQNKSMNQYRETESNNLLELKVHRLEREPSLLKQKPNHCEAKILHLSNISHHNLPQCHRKRNKTTSICTKKQKTYAWRQRQEKPRKNFNKPNFFTKPWKH